VSIPRNSAPEVPSVLSFDTIPSLREFFAHGGVPGVEYLFVTPQNQPRAQREGWQMILGVPFFQIRGKDCTIMGRGKPLRNTPAMPGTSICKVFADGDLTGDTTTVNVAFTDAERADMPTDPSRTAKPKHTPTSSTLLR
jgi:hypothetical protein